MKRLRYFTILLVAAAGLLASAESTPLQAADDEASKYVQDIGNQALGIISGKGLSKEQKQAKLENVFSNSVDFQWVGRFVLGRFWKQANDDQKTRYLAEYKKFLLLSYTSRFANYSSGSFKVTSSRDDGDNEFTVSTKMQAGDTQDEPVLVDYRIRKTGTSFRIFDVIVEGVSLLTTQRSEFASVINNKGLDYLINQLADKAAAGSHDTKAKNG